MRTTFYLVALSVLLCSCAPIQHTAAVSQPVNAMLTAGPGDVIVRVDKKRNLTNAFGGSDIWGAKLTRAMQSFHLAALKQTEALSCTGVGLLF